jgi:response regulator RpfG family c-di-GMP phosphodiesterase
MALERAGRWFDPSLVSALLSFRDDGAFWGPLSDPGVVPAAAACEPDDRVVMADDRRLDRVAEAFARVIDAKSPYETAASHHERLDGRGYHRGLAAFDLSRPARVLAVADVYEALTADRPYRGPMPQEQALAILREDRGVGLCPAAVDALERAATAPARQAGLAEAAAPPLPRTAAPARLQSGQ